MVALDFWYKLKMHGYKETEMSEELHKSLREQWVCSFELEQSGQMMTGELQNRCHFTQ